MSVAIVDAPGSSLQSATMRVVKVGTAVGRRPERVGHVAICTSNALVLAPKLARPRRRGSSRRRTSNAGRGASSAVSAAFRGMRTTDIRCWASRAAFGRRQPPGCAVGLAVQASEAPRCGCTAKKEARVLVTGQPRAAVDTVRDGTKWNAQAAHRQLDQPPNAVDGRCRGQVHTQPLSCRADPRDDHGRSRPTPHP